MKYADYKKHFETYYKKMTAHQEEFQPISVEMHKISEENRRHYEIGKTNPTKWQDGASAHVSVSMHREVDIYLRVATASGHCIDVHNFLELTASQLTKLAEIRRVVEQWMLGEIDELPPSGTWPTK